MTSRLTFDDRRRSLEEEFFAKQNQSLLLKMRENAKAEARREALSTASGIVDTGVLERLMTLQIEPETLTALTLIPLIQVAWSDGSVSKKEKDAVLKAATTVGLASKSASYQLLEHWLAHEPREEMYEAWREYVAALMATLPVDVQVSLRKDVMRRARRVAEAAGGFLGLTRKISDAEQRTLDEIDSLLKS